MGLRVLACVCLPLVCYRSSEQCLAPTKLIKKNKQTRGAPSIEFEEARLDGFQDWRLLRRAGVNMWVLQRRINVDQEPADVSHRIDAHHPNNGNPNGLLLQPWPQDRIFDWKLG